MLVVLVSNQGRLLTKDELMRAVWADAIVEVNNLDKNIYVLRKALAEDETGHKLIETVRGHGYRFTAPVTELEARPAQRRRLPRKMALQFRRLYLLPDGSRQGGRRSALAKATSGRALDRRSVYCSPSPSHSGSAVQGTV